MGREGQGGIRKSWQLEMLGVGEPEVVSPESQEPERQELKRRYLCT